MEVLSSVSNIRDMGFTGLGTTIAVIDTGINRNHEQFGGRVIAENCFNSGYKFLEKDKCEACDPDEECDYACYTCEGPSCEIADSCEACSSDDPECSYICYEVKNHDVCKNDGGSSLPDLDNLIYADSYNHGPHVTGIAAGENGIAPGADIVAVNIQSEFISPEYITETNPYGYVAGMLGQDILAALDWLLELQDELSRDGKTISIVNLSFGGGAFETVCDDADGYEEFFDAYQRIRDAGMIPVAASGNHFTDGAIMYPACFSNVMAVGALAGMDEPMIVPFSDHNDLVDILAPGTNIYSSYLVNLDENGMLTCTENCYGVESGTSMATPIVSGSLSLLMQAFPDKTIEEYTTMLTEMSTKTVFKRNSNDPYNISSDDQTGTEFDFPKPILDFSKFSEYFLMHRSLSGNHGDQPGFFCFPFINLPRTGFSSLRPQELRAQPLSVQYAPTNLTLQLPTLSVESEILTVPEVNGEYPVEWLGSLVGMLEGCRPGKGITILTGHNHLNTTEAGPFFALGTLNIGDRVVLSDAMAKTYMYKVSGNYKIAADSFASIAGNLGEKTLVMITCEDESVDGGYLHRRVIFAEPL